MPQCFSLVNILRFFPRLILMRPRARALEIKARALGVYRRSIHQAAAVRVPEAISAKIVKMWRV